LNYIRAALKSVLITILIIASVQCFGQFEGKFKSFGNEYQDTVWIVTGKKELGSLFQKQKLDFVLDARQTLISTTTARLGGIRIGIEYRRVHRFGIGIYGLSEGVQMNSLIDLNPNISEAVLSLSYGSLFYERVLFFNRKWEWSATVHLGKRQISGNYRVSPDSAWQSFPVREVKPFELSTTGYYHLTWWCSIGTGFGYRFMRDTPDEVRYIYNAPVAIARIRIKVGKLVKSIWDENAKLEY